MSYYNYNPITNDFVVYKNVEIPEVKLNLPTFDQDLDISDWANNITPDGNIIIKSNIPGTTDTQPSVEENISENANPQVTNIPQTTIQNNYSIKQDLSGNKKKAMDFFISKGLKPYQAAGIVGNLMMESGLNYQAVNPNSKAYGLAQWLGNRKTKLISKYGKNPTFEQQLDFLWSELNSSEKKSFDSLLRTSSVEEAVNSFMRNFERPHKVEMANSILKRVKFGRSLLS